MVSSGDIWWFPWPWGDLQMDGLFHGTFHRSKRMMTRGTPMSGNLQMLDMNGYDDITCLGIDMMILLVLGIKQDIDTYDHLSSIGLDKLWI